MRYHLLILILCFLTVCTKTVVKKDFYKNGQLKEEISYKGGQAHGLYEAYYENGKLRVKGIYENGKMVGTWKYWYDNGSLMSQGTYEENKLINLQAWDKEGNQTIKDGTGTAILFYPDGTPMSQVTYKDCLMDGEWKTWFENGKLESEFYFDNGNPTGIWKFWNPDGTLQRVEKHNGGMED